MWIIHLPLLLALSAAGAQTAPGTASRAAVPPRLQLEQGIVRSSEKHRSTLTDLVVIDAGDAPRWQGERIRLSTRDADLVEVLRAFARLAGVNLVVDPTVKGTVTVELHDVPWDQALWVILRTHRLGATLDGRLWAVRPSSPPP